MYVLMTYKVGLTMFLISENRLLAYPEFLTQSLTKKDICSNSGTLSQLMFEPQSLLTTLFREKVKSRAKVKVKKFIVEVQQTRNL